MYHKYFHCDIDTPCNKKWNIPLPYFMDVRTEVYEIKLINKATHLQRAKWDNPSSRIYCSFLFLRGCSAGHIQW